MDNKTQNRSFWALLGTQFFGAFNDNVFQIVVALLIVRWVEGITAQKLVALSGIVFAIPFLLFSLAAGRLADRWSKRKIIVLVKSFDLFIVAIAITGIYMRSIPMIMAGLFLLALQSTFFAPSKYGILPELRSEAELSTANGYLNGASVVAMLLGNIVGTLIIGNIHLIAVVTGLMAVGSILGSLLIEKTPAANPAQPLQWNPWPDLFSNWALIRGSRPLVLSLIASSYFWFIGGVMHLNTLVYVKQVMHLSDQVSGVLLTAIVVGIALGSWLAGKLSQGKVELGLVPLGAIGVSAFTIDLYFSHGSLTRTLRDAFILGASSGFFVIPLNTLIQLQSPKSDRGRILATSNFLSFIAIALAGGFLWLMGAVCKADPAQIFLVLGSISLLATAAILYYLPQSFVRLVLYFLTNFVYRLRVIGRANVPISGPALLVPNHVSMVDPFLVAGAISRSVRFIMFRDMYEKPLIHPFAKFMEVIPVSDKDKPKDILRSLLQARKKLEEGHVVCIFAEGQISRQGGFMMGFKRGIEVIMKGMDVPVVPVHLEGVWGSIFSFEGGQWLWKWPKRLPYPVTVTFGEPLQNPSSAQIRQSVMDLGADAFAIHRKKEPTLFETFLGQAKAFPRQKIVCDSSGKELTYRQLLTLAAILGKKIHESIGAAATKGSPVGVLLPPSVGAVAANLALTAEGCIPINLNYTLSRQSLLEICQKAGIGRVVTSDKMLKKLGWPPEERFVILESLLAKVTLLEKLSAVAAVRFLPRFILRRTIFRVAPGTLEDTATVMFTSGSTGAPKGVVLTQGNILSNIQALTMILHMREADVLLGVLPFFHSFGYTVTLWLPLLAAFKAAYHTNPLDCKTIGKICREQRVTFMLGTPTFLSAYLRKLPKEDLSSVRFVVAGAEKLRPELAQAFESKYGVPILEGYGCTELSPAVAMNVPDIMDGDVMEVGRKVGKIGRPLPGISVKIVDPESFQPLGAGTNGLMLVRGPNVMKGYLNDPEKTREVMRDGWYITGDISAIDDDGFIEITDRLSRFSKIGGEMVPHIKIEAKLHELTRSLDRCFVVTSVPDARKGEALAVLSAGFAGDVDQLWKDLNASDLPKLWIPDRDKFFAVESLPTLGSGKIDMPKVKSTITDRLSLMQQSKDKPVQ